MRRACMYAAAARMPATRAPCRTRRVARRADEPARRRTTRMRRSRGRAWCATACAATRRAPASPSRPWAWTLCSSTASCSRPSGLRRAPPPPRAALHPMCCAAYLSADMPADVQHSKHCCTAVCCWVGSVRLCTVVEHHLIARPGPDPTTGFCCWIGSVRPCTVARAPPDCAPRPRRLACGSAGGW